MVYFQTPLPPNSTTQYPHHHRKTILLDQNLDKQQQQSSSTSPSSSSSSSPKKRKWPDHDHMSSLHHHQTQLRTNNNKSDLMTSSLDLHLNNKNPPYSTIPLALSDSSKGSLNLAFDQPAAHQVVHNFYYSSPASRFHSNNNNITQQEEIPKTATTTSSSSANHMISLDLALNLPSSSSSTPNSQDVIQLLKSTPTPNKKQISKPNPNRRSELTITAAAAATDDKHDRDTKSINTAARSTLALFSSSPAFDKRSDRKVIDPQQEEMVAAACMRCHMLVMMCKSSPSCPNCKFMHPPDHTLPSLMLNPTLSLSC